MERSDPIVVFESEWYSFDNGYFDELRKMETLVIEDHGYKVVINYAFTASMYGFCGFIAYFWVTVCLIVVSLYIDNDVVD